MALSKQGKVSDREGTDAVEIDLRLSIRTKIVTLVTIAANNGSSISSDELRALLPVGVFDSTELLERFLEEDEELRRQLIVARGEVAPRRAHFLTASRNQQRSITEERVKAATSFAAGLRRMCPHLLLIAVSGSTAYGGAKAHDDIDFFLVTGEDRLWISLLIVMLVARVTRTRDPGAPVYCFNRVTEYAECAEAFEESSDPLFAREALNLRVLAGEETYRNLLEISPWMERLFPALYREKLRPRAPTPSRPGGRPAPHWCFANLLAFGIVAPYLWLAGLVRNAKLAKDGRSGARFRTVVRRRFCAYESKKYEDLRAAYREAF